jgi:glycerophosphoryl diester phosphodiesterase
MSTMIIAHRGASYDAPENTLSALRLAWEQGADAVEVDVHQSADGELVVIHDATTRKTAGVNRRVSAASLRELQALDVGRWKHRRWAGERIPTLEEAIRTVPRRKRIFAEIKCGVKCLPRLVEIVRASGRARDVVPIGFDLVTMQLVKWALPECEVAWVAAFRRSGRRWSPGVDALIRQARAAGVDALDVGVVGPVGEAFIRRVHEAGLKLYLWTVDAPERARELVAARADGLTTNRPGWLRTQLAPKGYGSTRWSRGARRRV